MFCCFCGCPLEASFVFCPGCGKKKDGNSEASTSSSSSDAIAIAGSSSSSRRQTAGVTNNAKSTASVVSLSAFMKKKEAERRSYFEPKRKKARATSTPKNTEALITIGLMEYDHEESDPRRVFGKTFPVKVTPDMSYEQVLERSLTKWENYDRTFSRDRGYILVYPDGKLARTIPGGTDEFIMGKYKAELGKPYSRINMYLCPVLPKSKEKGKDDILITDLISRNEESDIDEDLEEVPDCVGEHTDMISQSSECLEDNEIEDGNLSSYAVTDFLPIGIDENDAVQQAIHSSLCMHMHDEDALNEDTNDNDQETLSSDGFIAVVKEHAENKIQGVPRNIVVSRISIWQTAHPYFKRKGFLDRSGILRVTFATFEGEEDAVDHGGPRREFFHLLLGAIVQDSGTVNNTQVGCIIRCNVGALKHGTFYTIGNMLATLILQGGEFPRILSNSVCQFIEAGFDGCRPTIDEVPDKNVRDSLSKLKTSRNQNDVDKVFAECEWRFDIDGLPQTLSIEDKNAFIDEVAKYFLVIKCQPMLNQLIDGLKYYDVLEKVRAIKEWHSIYLNTIQMKKLIASN